MKGTVELRDKIARSKYVKEDELEKLDRIQQEIKTTMQKILEEGGMTVNA
jgi:V/A-type H+-transporting ATPase subunit A